ncbi:max-like protein X isoform X2 [Nematostella vectensis]|uniref:max-like protein X isoform X2 n=1 Tax=Nematostella vectensis TaxID=45351 RepID=UPI0013906839|nr:max-like protein X isoform X2 [Nematostella vectensis]
MAVEWNDTEIVSLSSEIDDQQNSDSIDVKSEPPSPEDGNKTIDSDALDELDFDSSSSSKQNRRFAHSVAEQKRRDAIKKGYDDLQSIVPTCQHSTSAGSPKLSKAIILQRTIEYVSFMHHQRKKHEEELEKLRKEVLALKIMKQNYEQIARAHADQFKAILDNQFVTFDGTVVVNDFDSLSSGIFHWLEEYCKPQYFMDTVIRSLRTLSTQGVLQT